MEWDGAGLAGGGPLAERLLAALRAAGCDKAAGADLLFQSRFLRERHDTSCCKAGCRWLDKGTRVLLQPAEGPWRSVVAWQEHGYPDCLDGMGGINEVEPRYTIETRDTAQLLSEVLAHILWAEQEIAEARTEALGRTGRNVKIEIVVA